MLAPLLAVLVGGGTAIAATYVVVTTQAPAAAPADPVPFVPYGTNN